MSTELPAPRYTQVGLQDFLQRTAALIPCPPGDPSTWTCVLALLGPKALLAKDGADRIHILNDDLLREILQEAGRPCRAEESKELLLVSPLPGDTDLVGILKRMLRHSRYWARQRSALLLGHLDVAEAIPALLANLDDSDNDARRGAAEALGLLGAEQAVTPLITRNWDGDETVNAIRLISLIKLGDWDAAADAVEEASEGEWRDLLIAMQDARGGDVDSLGEYIGHDNEEYKRVVYTFLVSEPTVAAAVAEGLIEALENEQDDTLASLVTRAVGQSGEDAVELLGEALENGDWRARMFYTAALAWSGESGHAVSDAIIARLEDDDSDVKREAALACAALGLAPGRPEGILTGSWTGQYGYIHRALLLAPNLDVFAPLNSLLGDAPPSKDLVHLLTTSACDTTMRSVAGMLLGLAEPDISWVLLDTLARDDSRDLPLEVRRGCSAGVMLSGMAPGRLGVVHRTLLCHRGDVNAHPQGSVSGLRGRGGELATLASTDGDWQIRLDALRLLQKLGDEAEPFHALIEHLSLHDSDDDVRKQAMTMKPIEWQVKSLAEQLATTLVQPRGSSNDNHRSQALRQLAELDSDLGRSLAEKFLLSDERALGRAAASVLGPTLKGEKAESAISNAIARLTSDNWVTREVACDLLGYLNLHSIDEGLVDEVVESLRERISEDYDEDVKNAARASLSRLGHSAT